MNSVFNGRSGGCQFSGKVRIRDNDAIKLKVTPKINQVKDDYFLGIRTPMRSLGCQKIE